MAHVDIIDATRERVRDAIIQITTIIEFELDRHPKWDQLKAWLDAEGERVIAADDPVKQVVVMRKNIILMSERFLTNTPTWMMIRKQIFNALSDNTAGGLGYGLRIDRGMTIPTTIPSYREVRHG